MLSEAECQVALHENEARVFAGRAKRSDDRELSERLADLPTLKYERLRESLAKHLNCRAPVLDRLITEQQKLDKQAAKSVASVC